MTSRQALVSPAAVMPPAWIKPSRFEAVECVGDAVPVQNLFRAQGLPAADPRSDVIVQLQQLDLLQPQPLEARFQAALDPARNIVHVLGFEPDLGGHLGTRHQRLQMAADGFLRRAMAVDRRGVDPIDAAGDRAPQRVVARRLVGFDQDPAGNAAAERELGYFKPGPPE